MKTRWLAMVVGMVMLFAGCTGNIDIQPFQDDTSRMEGNHPFKQSLTFTTTDQIQELLDYVYMTEGSNWLIRVQFELQTAPGSIVYREYDPQGSFYFSFLLMEDDYRLNRELMVEAIIEPKTPIHGSLYQYRLERTYNYWTHQDEKMNFEDGLYAISISPFFSGKDSVHIPSGIRITVTLECLDRCGRFDDRTQCYYGQCICANNEQCPQGMDCFLPEVGDFMFVEMMAGMEPASYTYSTNSGVAYGECRSPCGAPTDCPASFSCVHGLQMTGFSGVCLQDCETDNSCYDDFTCAQPHECVGLTSCPSRVCMDKIDMDDDGLWRNFQDENDTASNRCSMGFTYCEKDGLGCCVDTQTDSNHCGACFKAITGKAQVCRGGGAVDCGSLGQPCCSSSSNSAGSCPYTVGLGACYPDATGADLCQDPKAICAAMQNSSSQCVGDILVICDTSDTNPYNYGRTTGNPIAHNCKHDPQFKGVCVDVPNNAGGYVDQPYDYCVETEDDSNNEPMPRCGHESEPCCWNGPAKYLFCVEYNSNCNWSGTCTKTAPTCYEDCGDTKECVEGQCVCKSEFTCDLGICCSAGQSCAWVSPGIPFRVCLSN